MSTTTEDIELGNLHADPTAGSAELAPEEPVRPRRYPRLTLVRFLSSIVPITVCRYMTEHVQPHLLAAHPIRQTA